MVAAGSYTWRPQLLEIYSCYILTRDLLAIASFLFPHKRLKYLFVRRMISVIYILSKIYSMHKLVILYIINLLVHIHTYVYV